MNGELLWTVTRFPARETWEDNLDLYLEQVREWLYEPANVHEAVEAVEEVLTAKHHDYGEDNLRQFGELGILMRVSDKVARLKNLLGKQGEVVGESVEDTWRDLAGYAIQALIMMRMDKSTKDVNVFEIRKNRLVRGMCPDCGEGVLLRESFWENRLHCSEDCGFETGDLYELHLSYPDFSRMIDALAAEPAYGEQK